MTWISFSLLLGLCARNRRSLVYSPHKGPLMASFYVLFVANLNKLLNKKSGCGCYDAYNDWNPSPWWCHQMETFSALLALCAGNLPVTGEFPTQRPVSRSFDVFFDLRLNQQLSKQWRRRWYETPSRSISRNCNGYRPCWAVPWTKERADPPAPPDQPQGCQASARTRTTDVWAQRYDPGVLLFLGPLYLKWSHKIYKKRRWKNKRCDTQFTIPRPVITKLK